MNKILLLFAFILAACNPYAPTPAAPTATATRPAQLLQAETISPTATPAPRVCIVSTGIQDGNLNIRTGPGTSSAVIGTLKEDQQLTIIKTSGNWLYVRPLGMLAGYINSKFCKGDK